MEPAPAGTIVVHTSTGSQLFRPPLNAAEIRQTLVDSGFGVGALLDTEGFAMLSGRPVPPGNYTYAVTAAAASAGGAGGMGPGRQPTGVSPSEAKTVEIFIPAVLHGDDVENIVVTFDNDEEFWTYLSRAQCTGLQRLDEGPKLLVTKFSQLVPNGTYTHGPASKEAFARLLGEARHLQQAREDEFATALAAWAQQDEPEQGYALAQDLRMQPTKDGKMAELDVVVKGKDKAYVGSHKTYAKSARPVKEIAERCAELAELDNALPSVVMPAFMVERAEPEAMTRIQQACKDLKVVRCQRSGKAIKVENRMGAAGRLLRF